MILKIIGDGTPRGTRVVNAETGEEVEGVYMVTFSHYAHSVPQAVIYFYDPEVDVEVSVEMKE
jgi:hypothetical protein